MKVGLYYRVLIHDRKGKLVKRTHWKECHSFVRQFLQLFDSSFSHAAGGVNSTTISVKDINNTSRTMGATLYANHLGGYLWAGFAPDDNSNYGIEVGTGSTPETNSDYNIGTKIAHGTGAGQLDYGAHSRTAAQVVGANVDFVFSRTFYNGSGNIITVNEIGVVVEHCDSTNPGAIYYFLIIRDVITPVDVANAQTLTVQYTMRTTA